MSDFPLEISVQETADLLAAQANVRVIDCREQDEYAIARLPHSELVPLSDFPTLIQASLGSTSVDQHIIIHCHHGGRSLRAANFLRQKGFSKAQSMAGGIEEWSRQIDGSVPRY